MVCFLEQELRTGSGLISDDRVKGKIPIFVVNSSRSSCLTHCLKCHKTRQIILYTFSNQSAFSSEFIPYFSGIVTGCVEKDHTTSVFSIVKPFVHGILQFGYY